MLPSRACAGNVDLPTIYADAEPPWISSRGPPTMWETDYRTVE